MATIPNGQRIVMLLLELYDVMPMYNNLSITQRYLEIANILGIAERPAMRALSALCDHGFLVKEANAHEKEKKANTWCFTSKMIGSSYSKQYLKLKYFTPPPPGVIHSTTWCHK